MALPQFSSLGRSVFSRTSASCFPASSRAFTSCTRQLQESNISPKKQLTEEARKRSVAILKLPKQATKTEVESLFQKSGLQITKSQLRFDRFTFYNDTFFFAELANSKQASDAVSKLHRSTVLGEAPIILRPLDPNFSWKNVQNPFDRYAYDEGANVAKAVLPIKEGRRVQLRVRTPGWEPQFDTKPEHLQKERKAYGQELVRKSFERFGIEAMGLIASNDGRMLPEPKFYCQIDFKTKEGADDAIRTMHNTKLEGLLIWVTKTELNEVRSRQIGRVNMGVLEEMQGLGLAPEVDFEK